MEQFVITLIAPIGQPLEANTLNLLRGALDESIFITGVNTLAEHRAYDILFNSHDSSIAQQIITPIADSLNIDAVIQSPDNRRKKLLISDMDSTMINEECIDELAHCVGKKDYIAAITERAMNGELDFKEALRERVALLAGLSEQQLESTYREHITAMPGAKKLINVMKNHGAYCVLVSGGFTFFTSRVRNLLGFHQDEANILDIQHGKLTGQVVEPILDKEAKLASLKQHTEQCGIRIEETLAVGDGANDLPMLLGAGLGVAYHAKKTVRAQAKAAINHNDLEALLYVQGYAQQEIDAHI